MRLSVIVPTFNEEENIAGLIKFLMENGDNQLHELIVCDGLSTDNTVAMATHAGAKVLSCPQRGRAAQMNYAASRARGDVLYFVHADTIPPQSFVTDIQKGLDQGYMLGGYCSKFLSDNPLFKLNAWFTDSTKTYSLGGDQTLYVDRKLFERLNGFSEKHVIMEDFDFVKRAMKIASYKKISKSALISTRKYQNNSFFRVSVANFIVFSLYRLGVAPHILKKIYGSLLK